MTNKARQRGTAFENWWVGLLNRAGFKYAERRALAGTNDRGDVVGIPRWCFEVKAVKQYTIPGFLAEAEAERVNAHADYAAVVLKLPRKPIEECAVIMRAGDFVRMLAELEGIT